MALTVVRVEAKTHATLRAWSEAQGKSIGQVVAELVEKQERELIWQRMRADYERLQADPAAWKEYQDDVALFEGGSMDGLEGEEPYYSPEEEEEIRAYARSQGWPRVGEV
jgi:hypothetical protein